MAKGQRRIVRTRVRMRADIKVTVGDTLFYPSSGEVSAGEPSALKNFHAMYHDKECEVIGIRKAFRAMGGTLHTLFMVRFRDGAEQELLAEAFIYIGKKPTRKKKEPKSGRPLISKPR